MIARYELRTRAKNDEPIIRYESKPAQQMQVDWIEFPKDNLSAFVATMGYSRASYVEYVNNEKIETLIGCHMNAFSYFGGVPRECLYDNMQTVILDRVLHHSHIINIQGDSYRLKEKKQTGVLHSEIYKFEAKSSNQSSQNSEVV